MNRRNILSVIALAPIAACSSSVSTTIPITPNAISSDIDLVINGLRSLLPYIVQPATAARYNSYLDSIAALGKQIAVSVDANSTKSLVQQIIAVASDALNVVATVPQLPAMAKTIITATQVMLPFIAAAAGIFGLRQAPSTMSVEQARAVLARRV